MVVRNKISKKYEYNLDSLCGHGNCARVKYNVGYVKRRLKWDLGSLGFSGEEWRSVGLEPRFTLK